MFNSELMLMLNFVLMILASIVLIYCAFYFVKVLLKNETGTICDSYIEITATVSYFRKLSADDFFSYQKYQIWRFFLFS